jgi:AcrR family transcriptional regulator
MPARKLPDNSVLLRERDVEGLSISAIADRYGVTRAAVTYRFKKMGRDLGRTGAMDYTPYIPWVIRSGHHELDAPTRLRAHILRRTGGEVTPAAQRRLDNWHARLAREDVVLTYSPDDASPWIYVQREPSDAQLIVRWPNDLPPPTDEQRAVLALPDES